jgi:hypothetical protein
MVFAHQEDRMPRKSSSLGARDCPSSKPSRSRTNGKRASPTLISIRRSSRSGRGCRRHHLELVEWPNRRPNHEAQARQTTNVRPRKARSPPGPRRRASIGPICTKSASEPKIDPQRLAFRFTRRVRHRRPVRSRITSRILYQNRRWSAQNLSGECRLNCPAKHPPCASR